MGPLTLFLKLHTWLMSGQLTETYRRLQTRKSSTWSSCNPPLFLLYVDDVVQEMFSHFKRQSDTRHRYLTCVCVCVFKCLSRFSVVLFIQTTLCYITRSCVNLLITAGAQRSRDSSCPAEPYYSALQNHIW